ncbi:hypothetical protein [Paenibacillus sp. S150]|nr:hypothetical protein [Paenibacillus sp. S150]
MWRLQERSVCLCLRISTANYTSRNLQTGSGGKSKHSLDYDQS